MNELVATRGEETRKGAVAVDDLNATSITVVQGKATSTFGYEFLRIVGFPAVVETHATCGVGYEFSFPVFSIHDSLFLQ